MQGGLELGGRDGGQSLGGQPRAFDDDVPVLCLVSTSRWASRIRFIGNVVSMPTRSALSARSSTHESLSTGHGRPDPVDRAADRDDRRDEHPALGQHGLVLRERADANGVEDDVVSCAGGASILWR